MSFRLYGGPSIEQRCFIADTSMKRVFFLGTIKLTNKTTRSKSYKKQIIADSLWQTLFYDQD